ncbi:MAG TPA: hypothetical protein VFE19_09775 [Jatrophihabitantaceae bacterium]|jgi:hypothetical protein|nr:hypothetical protein [Jatrophihabitantaceae bacterium]
MVIIGAFAGICIGLEAIDGDGEAIADPCVLGELLDGADPELHAVRMPASNAADPINDERFIFASGWAVLTRTTYRRREASR